MKDERIIRELNKTKLAIIYYVLITTTVVTIIKLLLSRYISSNFFVEGFILVLGVALLIIKLLMYKDEIDERIESSFDKIGNIFLSIMLFGGFFIHFLSQAYANQQTYLQINFTSTFVLIGFIVLLIQLKRRNIYLHFPLFIHPKNKYILKILTRIAIFGLIFSFNFLPYLFLQVNLLIGGLAIAISYLSLSVTYFLFALYERNHYEESEMIADGKIRKLTKNASLLYIIPIVFHLITTVFNSSYSYILFDNPNVQLLTLLSLINALIKLWGIDISIITILIYFIIRNHLKKLEVPKMLFTTINVFIVSSIIFAIISPIYTFGAPIIFRLINDIDLITKVTKISSAISLGVFIYVTVILSFIAYQLSKLVILDLGLFYAFITFPVLSLIMGHFAFLIESVFLLVLAGIVGFLAYISFYVFMKKQEWYIIDCSPSE